MVAARKKLATPLKKVIAVTALSPKITSTTLTLADTTIVLTMVDKRPCPSAEVISDVAQPMKRIKKKAKKGEHEILVMSS